MSASDLGRLLGQRELGPKIVSGARELSKENIRKLMRHSLRPWLACHNRVLIRSGGNKRHLWHVSHLALLGVRHNDPGMLK